MENTTPLADRLLEEVHALNVVYDLKQRIAERVALSVDVKRQVVYDSPRLKILSRP